MAIEKRFAGAATLVVSIVSVVICFAYSAGYAQQQSASVNIEFEVARPRFILAFTIDGTDAGYVLSGNEICGLGNVDSRGTPISGAPAGDPNVNGIAGLAVDSSGAPLAGFDDPGCVGAFYPLLAATGGSNNAQHPNSAICIYARLFFTGGWTLSTSAQLVTSTTNVTVGQLKWKMDATASNGYQSYTAFTTSSNLIASGTASLLITRYIYIDYGLLVEDADAPGANVWLITYTLVET